MKKLIYFSSLIVLLFLTSCSSKVDIEVEKTKLLQTDQDWVAAAKAGDFEKLWTFWDYDAIILLSADKKIQGMNEIKEFTKRSRTDPNFQINWKVEGADISSSGDLGYAYGSGSVTRTDENGEPITVTNPYLVVWKKQTDGTWKCVIEN